MQLLPFRLQLFECTKAKKVSNISHIVCVTKLELYHDPHVTFSLFGVENFITDYSLVSVYGLFPKQDYSRFIQVAVVIDFLNHSIIHFHIRVFAYPRISVQFVDALGQKVKFFRNLNVRISNVLGLLKSSASFFTTNLVTMSTTIIAGEYFFHRNKYNRTCSR